MNGVDGVDFPRLIIGGIVLAWVLGLGLYFWLRARYSRGLDRLGESTSEEMLAELDSAFPPQARVCLRTQTEYLPFVIEAIREQIDGGLDELRVQTLLARFEFHRPGQRRNATFLVEIDGVPSTLALSWVRDLADRIELEIRAIPPVVRALRDQRRRMPGARLERVET